MYATIRRYQLRSGSMDDLLHEVDVDFAETIQEAEGFIAYECMDSGEGMLTTISTFSDRESAEASTEMAETWIRDNLAGRYDLERLDVMTGELAVSRASEKMLVPAHH
jgi:quinol monooxygenase YgiN